MKLQTARGVKDTSPNEKIVKNNIINTLQEVFELYGFAPLETPIIERYETLAAKFAAGECSEALKETFKLTDQGKRKLGLRFDLTVPLARYVAMNPNLKMPFKRYEFGSVFRDGPIKAGRVRQFWQCDIDIIGSKSMLAEAEILAVVQKFFRKINLNAVIKVNNRKLLNGILKEAGIKKKEEAMIVIDKLDKIGKEGVEKELLEKGIKKKEIKRLFELIGKNVTLGSLSNEIKNDEGQEGLQELKELFGYLNIMGVNSVQFDVSLARGLAYYTGTIFEAFVKDGKITSSLAGGGRYDNMIGNFMGGEREVPAVGIAFGIVPIMECLNEKDFEKNTMTKVFVIPIKTLNESLKIIEQLREKEINVEFDLNSRGVSKNLQFVNALGIPYAIIIGEKELKQNKVLLRDMTSGDEQMLTIKEVVKKLR